MQVWVVIAISVSSFIIFISIIACCIARRRRLMRLRQLNGYNRVIFTGPQIGNPRINPNQIVYSNQVYIPNQAYDARMNQNQYQSQYQYQDQNQNQGFNPNSHQPTDRLITNTNPYANRYN
jgi:hypothetical protein